MADNNPGGLKHEQHLVYGTPLWRKVYGMRNGVESVNRNLKRAQFDDLANSDRRHVRGNTFTYTIATISAVMENIRKMNRPGFLRGSDLPTGRLPVGV